MPMNRFTVAFASLALSSLYALAQTPSGPFMTEMKSGMWRASKLHDLNVYNNDNEKVGDINELLLDQSGKVEAVVIGVGGFLGLGEHNVAVPFEQIKWSNEPVRSARVSTPPTPPVPGARVDVPDRSDITGAIRSTAAEQARRGYPDHAIISMTRDQLRAAPTFKYAVGGASTNQ
jgi:sporulation protein YlmC with PRC-barrel domain